MKKLQLLLLTLLLSAGAHAGSVRMKTAKAVGDKLTIAVNYGVPLSLTWSDGTKEEIVATGQPQELTVKGSTLTLSSEKDITSLYLADNELTELNVAGIVGTLRRLYCPNNQLTKLDLSDCKELVSLDCQGNQLSSLSVGSAQMEDYNVADNQLTAIGLRSAGNITSLVCANNKLTALGYVGSMLGLTSLFCQGNELTSVPVTRCVELRQLLAYDNKLKTVNTLPLVNLTDLWLGNNQLETLDLSDNTVIVGLMAENNRLSTIKWNSNMRNTAALAYADLSDNALFLDQLPSMAYKKVTVDGAIGHQDDYPLFDTDLNVNVATPSIRSLRRNGWDNSHSVSVVITEAGGQTLVADEDYKFTGSSFTFLKPYSGVVVAITSDNYPGLDVKTVPFNVIDPAGIKGVESEAAGSSEKGSDAIYDLSGRKLSETSASSATSGLPKGIYIVNGKKVVIK